MDMVQCQGCLKQCTLYTGDVSASKEGFLRAYQLLKLGGGSDSGRF